MAIIVRKSHFDSCNSLEEKIDRLMSMMSKLTALNDGHNTHFKPKIYQSRRRGQTRNFYDQNLIREVIKIEIDQIVEIGKYHSVVEYSMDRIIEIDQGTIRITEVTLEEVN